MIALIEKGLSRRAQIRSLSQQPGDIYKTCAHTGKAHRLVGYTPKGPIEKDIQRFIL